MARKTPRKKSPLGDGPYAERYERFTQQLHNAWMYYEVQPAVLALARLRRHNTKYQNKIIVRSVSPVNSDARAPIRMPGENLAGLITRTYRKEVPETVLLNSVSSLVFANKGAIGRALVG